jgi:hypothetical protein
MKALDDLVAAASAAFEAGQPLNDAHERVKAAELGLNDAELKFVERLAQTDEHRAAMARVGETERAVNEQRNASPQDPDALLVGSRAWIDAKGALLRLTNDAKAADPEVLGARAELEASQGAVDALYESFERSLAENPEVLAARQAVDVVREPYAAAEKALAAAEANAGAVQQARRNRAADADRARKAIDELERDAEPLRNDLAAVSAAVADADERLSYALASLDHARAAREAAVASVYRCEAAERIVVCNIVVIRRPWYNNHHHHDHHNHHKGHDGDHDRHGPEHRDRNHDGGGGSGGTADRPPRLNGAPVGRPRRTGGSEFVAGGGGGTPAPMPATPATPVPSTPPGDDAGRAPRVDGRAAARTGGSVRESAEVDRRRAIAEAAAEAERRTKQREDERAQVAAGRLLREQAREAERQPKAEQPRRGGDDAIAAQQRQAAQAAAAVAAERERQQSRVAEAAQEQARRAERDQQRAARESADRARDAQRAAERQREAADRDSQRQRAEQERQQRREADRPQQQQQQAQQQPRQERQERPPQRQERQERQDSERRARR